MRRLVLLVLLVSILIITQALEAKAAKKPREITIYPFSGQVDDIMALAKPKTQGLRRLIVSAFHVQPARQR